MNTSFRPIEHPAAWTRASLDQDDGWILRLGDADLAELDRALESAKARGATVPTMVREDFPLDALAARLRSIAVDLTQGRGLVLVKGLPMDRWSKADAGLVFWGLGRHLGTAIAQNAYGDVLGHVFDLGRDPRTDVGARGYQSNLGLAFHTDGADVVGLMCLRTALRGGASSVVRALSVYNEMGRRRPDLLARLHEDFHLDARNENAEGQAPHYAMPIYQRLGDRAFCRYVRRFIDSAQRFPDVPRLDAGQLEALTLFESLQADPTLRVDMDLEPGDLQFVCNYVTLHSRTAYEDHAEIDRKRHLLRLWLMLPEQGPIPDSYAQRARVSEHWSRNARAPIYDIAQLMGASAH